MATVEERYKAATAYVHRAADAVEHAPSFLNVIDRYAAVLKTQPVRAELATVEARWLRAASDDDRARIARDAELLADRTKESLPGAPQDWQRTNLYVGERETATAATSFGGDLSREASADWAWFTQHVKEAADVGGGVGKWLLAGGAVLLGIKGVNFLERRERQRNQGARSLRRQLDRGLERAADETAPTAEEPRPLPPRDADALGEQRRRGRAKATKKRAASKRRRLNKGAR